MKHGEGLRLQWVILAKVTTAAIAAHASLAFAQSVRAREQASMIHQRLTGTPATPEVLLTMANLIDQRRVVEAALETMKPSVSLGFYQTTLKAMGNSFTNRDMREDVPLNDFTATFVGLVYEDRAFDEILWDDVVYTAAADTPRVPAIIAGNTGLANLQPTVGPALNHYRALERHSNWSQRLQRQTQSTIFNVPAIGNAPSSNRTAADTAGGLTSYAWGISYGDAGTNRRYIEAVAEKFLCQPLEQLNDTTLAGTYVARDVERTPAGSSEIFMNRCLGCHSFMDPLRDAFARLDWDPTRGTKFISTGVQDKVKKDSTVMWPSGYIPTNDAWFNLLPDSKKNAGVLGFQSSSDVPDIRRGQGVKSFGRLISLTKAFPRCMANRAFEKVCLRPAMGKAEREALDAIGEKLRTQDSFKLKMAFARATELCLASMK